MTAPPDFAIEAALIAGRYSPCAKSKRGAAVFSPAGAIFGSGYNHPPLPFACTADERCRSACAHLCEHAEQIAIRLALIDVARERDELRGYDLHGLQLVHAKVVDGRLVAGGGPSCWQCSRLVVGVRLDAVWLYEAPRCTCGRAGWVHDDGCHVFPTHGQAGTWRRYTAEEFHRETLTACGLGGQS